LWQAGDLELRPKKLRKGGVKLLKSRARVNLCAGARAHLAGGSLGVPQDLVARPSPPHAGVGEPLELGPALRREGL
jgi:hypothetical protein